MGVLFVGQRLTTLYLYPYFELRFVLGNGGVRYTVWDETTLS